MAFNIADFQSQIADTGILQTNKYDVDIFFGQGSGGTSMASLSINDPTTGSGGSTGGAASDLSYRCVNASLPGITLRTTDINRFGIGVYEKMPYSGNFTDISLTFICDRYGAAYNFWYTWLNYIFGVTGEKSTSNIFGNVNTGAASGSNASRPFSTAEYKSNYAATIVITVYDNGGDVALQATLLDAFPITMNDIALSWSDNNNLVKITTTVTFKEWVLGDSQQSTSLSAVRTA